MDRRMFLAGAAALGLAACATTSRREGLLEGRIWDPRAARFIGEDEAVARIAAADYALLGETHDNAVHHAIQLRLLRACAQGSSPAVAFEQMDRDWQAELEAARAAGTDAEGLMKAAHMARSWSWPLYEPLVAFAMSHGLRIVALNFSREHARPVVASGLAAIGAEEADRLALAATWNPQRNALQRELVLAGHCGQDDPIIDKLVDVQRVRDAYMADGILAAPRTIAIIGRGHARRDVGVPLYLAARAPVRSVVSLGLLEVEEGAVQPQDYDDAAAGVHDIVWFTPRASRPDMCAQLRSSKPRK